MLNSPTRSDTSQAWHPGLGGRERAGVGHGSAAAMAERWPDHYYDLVRYARHLLSGDTHGAEDVAQETAIRLWQHPEVLADGEPLIGWLRTVARNIVLDRSRRRRARPTEVAMTTLADRPGPDEFDDVEARSAVDIALSVLSPRHRAVVLEVYVRDRPVAEVAGELGIPVGTVKSRCHEALRRLRSAAGSEVPRCA
jgi:RNA polymerase sigma-70 factor (ECF subfamily)